jgi:4-hydroxy-L-threonine phosphate dehydrogenase PdxA
VGTQTHRQELIIVPDPRVQASQADLIEQLNLSKSVAAQMSATYDTYYQTLVLREAIADRQKALAGNADAKATADAVKALDDKVAAVQEGKSTELGIGPLNRELTRMAVMLENGDARPATMLLQVMDEHCHALAQRLVQWHESNQSIAALNSQLQKYNLAPLPVAADIVATPACRK